jgi:hypothetical protein
MTAFDVLCVIVAAGGWLLALMLVIIRPQKSLRSYIALPAAVALSLVVAYAVWDKFGDEKRRNLPERGWFILIGYLLAFAVALYGSALRDWFSNRRVPAKASQRCEHLNGIVAREPSVASFRTQDGSTHS